MDSHGICGKQMVQIHLAPQPQKEYSNAKLKPPEYTTPAHALWELHTSFNSFTIVPSFTGAPFVEPIAFWQHGGNWPKQKLLLPVAAAWALDLPWMFQAK